MGNGYAYFQNVDYGNLNQHVQFRADDCEIHEKYPLALWQRPTTKLATKCRYNDIYCVSQVQSY